MTQSKPRTIKGQVVSDKMAKTAVVKVKSFKRHGKYLKQYEAQKRYQAHDEKNEYHIGDIVEIEESRPISKKKRWRVIRKIK